MDAEGEEFSNFSLRGRWREVGGEQDFGLTFVYYCSMYRIADVGPFLNIDF